MLDIVALQVNARMRKTKLNDAAKETIRKLNWADVRLYEHFIRKFKETAKKFGLGKMHNETKALSEVIDGWKYGCRKMGSQDEEYQDTCRLMRKKELPFTDMLRKRQLHLML